MRMPGTLKHRWLLKDNLRVKGQSMGMSAIKTRVLSCFGGLIQQPPVSLVHGFKIEGGYGLFH